ncbi:hypothetical protein CFAM422_004489 [Trichoderma lentiforme]|uniref:Mg2+ transporter protein, CorA-like/Zinc transport protein ZntB n=1 Tax=Trichoderma lentiforme TaxID=1567552 RepID=A0A9P5CDS9_9HYPO|nr:hypothetical protein CFAM422_004489 [Trichoderma lentiforme]
MDCETTDSYAFKKAVAECREISEKTSYLEIFSYSDSSLNSIEQHPLSMSEFDNFLHRKNAFAPPILPDNVHIITGLRLILQVDAQHSDTFAPRCISLPRENYSAMVQALHLPQMAIETSSVVGPFFWSTVDRDDNGIIRLHMIFRKSDVFKKARTRGWELILSHEPSTGITTGFYKGTPSSSMSESIQQLKACSSEIGHAMLLPLIIFSRESSSASDIRQRDVRQWLQRLERAISTRDGAEVEAYDEYAIDLDAVNRDLVECQAQVLWKRPASYIAIIDSLEEVSQLFIQTLPESRKTPVVEKFQMRMIARLDLYKKRWAGIQMYADTSMQRLEIQRSALYTMMSQKESRLNLEIASDSKKLAHATERESKSMKGISLLGTIFLPGTFLASIFSTTFFDFGNGTDAAAVVSPKFWVYWVFTIPFTLVVVGLYLLWERRRLREYMREDAELERDMETMERNILNSLRKRTQAKTVTWAARNERKAGLAADEENDYGGFKAPAATTATSSNTLAIPSWNNA